MATLQFRRTVTTGARIWRWTFVIALTLVTVGLGMPAQAKTGGGECNNVELQLTGPNNGFYNISTVFGGGCEEATPPFTHSGPAALSGTVAASGVSCHGISNANVNFAVNGSTQTALVMNMGAVAGTNFYLSGIGNTVFTGEGEWGPVSGCLNDGSIIPGAFVYEVNDPNQ